LPYETHAILEQDSKQGRMNVQRFPLRGSLFGIGKKPKLEHWKVLQFCQPQTYGLTVRPLSYLKPSYWHLVAFGLGWFEEWNSFAKLNISMLFL